MQAILFFLTLLCCVLPILFGLLGILFPAFNYLPIIQAKQISLTAFQQVIAWSGIEKSILLTLWTGLASSFSALAITYLLLSNFWQTKQWKKIEILLSPVLAVPHVAFAIGLAFLFSSTGWLNRFLILLDLPANLNLTQDQYGIGLILALTIKEIPFLLLMSLAILQNLDTERLERLGASLGYARQQIWLKVILPQWLPKLRLPFYAVLGYGLSVVDLSLILGPTQPSTFSVLIWQWFNDSDLNLLPRAAAGALSLLILALLIIALVRLLEWFWLEYFRSWQVSGTKNKTKPNFLVINLQKYLNISLYLLLLLPVLVLPLLILWSLAQRWQYPQLLPTKWSNKFWLHQLDNLQHLINTSLLLALTSTLISLVLVIGCLEFREKKHIHIPASLITIPMIVPQISFLFGIQVVILYFSRFLTEQWYYPWVIWSHIFYVFPYIYLSLDGAWQNYDQRFDQTALSLGLTPWQTWWKVKLPQLSSTISIAFAVGMSVSLAQYLSTQMLGAGRISTLTTEAVTLASGQDRRITAIYALLQGILPLIIFSVALFISRKFRIKYK